MAKERVEALNRPSRLLKLRRPGLFSLCLAAVLVATAARADHFPLTNLWLLITGKSDSTPALGDDGTIFFGNWKGILHAITTNGIQKWEFHTGLEIKSSPAIGRDGTIYVGSRDRSFYAVTPNGKKKWQFKTGGWIDSSPALATDGTIYFGSWDTNFYALRPDGTSKWQFRPGAEIVSSPAVGLDGTIYFGSHDKNFYALSPDGRKKWHFTTGAQIVSSPALHTDQCVYFASVDGFLYALNLDGTLRWRLRTGGVTESSPVIGEDGSIYIGVNQFLWRITPDGKKKWERLGDDLIESSALLFANQTLCFLSRHGQMIALDPHHPTLEMKWTHYFYGHGYASPTVGREGLLYLPCYEANGALAALPTGQLLAKSPWPKFRGNLKNTGNVSDAEN